MFPFLALGRLCVFISAYPCAQWHELELTQSINLKLYFHCKLLSKRKKKWIASTVLRKSKVSLNEDLGAQTSLSHEFNKANEHTMKKLFGLIFCSFMKPNYMSPCKIKVCVCVCFLIDKIVYLGKTMWVHTRKWWH